MIAEYVWKVWNSEKRPVKLSDIYEGVRAKIHRRIEDDDWPKVWIVPIRRTCDRRVNEAADKRFYEGPTAIICIKPGWYQANPALFDDSVRKDIAKAADTGELSRVGQSPTMIAPPDPFPLEREK